MKISITEINSYLRCPRAWDLTSASRQSLRHKITPKIFFVVGSAVHEAIDAQASGGDPLAAFETYVEKERRERVEYYEEQVGSSPYTSELKDFDESVELARLLVSQYFDHYTWENPLIERDLKYIATEIPFSIPLPNGVNFVGTFDGVATDIRTESVFFLLENKTAARKPNIDLVRNSNQFVGYNWAFRALTGQTPAGTLYNGIWKNPIKEPRLLKNGSLSQDKSARVTLASFQKALQRGNHDPTKYLDYIQFLVEREANGDDRFFFRDIFTYSNQQLDNWFSDVLLPVSTEIAENPRSYPNFTSCDNCLVADLCTAMNLGEDVDRVKEARYDVGVYGTMELARTATPATVNSVESLLETLRGN